MARLALDIAFGLVFEFAVADFDFALFVEPDDDDFQGVADFDDAIGIFDIFPAEAGDMA